MSQESRATTITITTTVCMLAMNAGAGDTEGLVSDMRPSAPGPGHTALEAANEPDTECHTRDPRSSSGGFGYVGNVQRYRYLHICGFLSW